MEIVCFRILKMERILEMLREKAGHKRTLVFGSSFDFSMVNKIICFKQLIVSVQNIFILKPTLFIKYSVIDFIFFIFEEIIIRLFKGKIFLVYLKMKYCLLRKFTFIIYFL